MTEYVVLQQADDSDGWHRIGPDAVESVTSDGAIRQVAETRSSVAASGAYVAVPLRSWKPMKVLVATKPTVTIEPDA